MVSVIWPVMDLRNRELGAIDIYLNKEEAVKKALSINGRRGVTTFRYIEPIYQIHSTRTTLRKRVDVRITDGIPKISSSNLIGGYIDCLPMGVLGELSCWGMYYAMKRISPLRITTATIELDIRGVDDIAIGTLEERLINYLNSIRVKQEPRAILLNCQDYLLEGSI